jgi:hypothetical protein
MFLMQNYTNTVSEANVAEIDIMPQGGEVKPM